MGSSTCGETLAITGTCVRMAFASPKVRVGAARVPARTPLTFLLPASIQTRLLPRFSSCRCTSCWPALPMAITQITAAMPIVIPSTVSRLRVLLRINAHTADRNSATWFIAAARSLVSQCFNGIEQRCLARRIVTEEYPHPGREQHRQHHRLRRHRHGPTETASDHIRSCDTRKHTRSPANQAQHHGLAEKLQANGIFGCAH